MKTKNILKLLGAIIICELAGGVGAIFVTPNISGWYSTLVKSSLTPPAFVFGPVWTLLYLLMGIAAFMILKKGFDRRDVRHALEIFSMQLVFNILWSIIFFGAHNPALAFVDIALLWLSIIATMFSFYRISRPTIWILLPYTLWTTFAAYLNLAILFLNR
jgi:tryptophan-rich sensory protein